MSGTAVAMASDPAAATLLEHVCTLLRGDGHAVPEGIGSPDGVGVPAARCLPEGPAGAALLDLAEQHRVHLLLAWCLGLSPQTLETMGERGAGADGGHAFARLAAQMRVSAMTDVLRQRELARVLAGLASAGIAPIVFKGAALAFTHYPATWLRPRLDTDILVEPAARGAALAALGALGYAPLAFVSGDLVMQQRPLVRPDGHGGEYVIDLHWRIANRQAVARVLGYDALAASAHTIPVLGQSMRVPAPDHALLLACLHRAAHHQDADDLLWLYDIHLLAGRLTVEQWSRFADLAVGHAITDLCARGLDLASVRFGTSPPAAVRERLARAPKSEPSSIFLQRDIRQIDVLASDLRALGPRAGGRLLIEVLFPPASYMREAFGAGGGVRLWIAYVRRFAGGIWRWIGPASRA